MASRDLFILLIATSVSAFVPVSSLSPAMASDWTVVGGGSWTVVGNWSDGIPDSIDAVASFAQDTPDATDFVIIDVSGTVGTLILQDTASSANYGWDLRGTSLILDASAGNVLINFRESLHEIQADLVLMDDLDATYTQEEGNRRANLNGDITSGDGLTTDLHINRINPWGSGSYGRVVLYGNNTFNGNVTVHNGNLQIGQGNAIPDTADLQINSGAMLTMINSEALNALNGEGVVRTHPGFGTCTLTVGASGGSGSFSGVIRDDGTGITALWKTGAGTQVLSGANTYTGGTTVEDGILQLGSDDVLADTGSLEINGGTLDIGTYNDTVGAVTLTSGTITGTTGVLTGDLYTVKSGTVDAILGGSGNLLKSDTGSVTLGAANTYTGTTTVSAGTLLLGDPAALGSGSSPVQLGDANTGTNDVTLLTDVWPEQGKPAAFTISQSIHVNDEGTGQVTIGSNAAGESGKYVVFSGAITMEKALHLQGLNVDRTTFSGPISGTGDLYIDGPRRITFDKTNTYSGNTYITGGTAQFQNGNAIPDTSTVIMSSGTTLLVWSASEAIDGLEGTGSVRIGYTSQTFTIGARGGSGSFSGSLGEVDGGVLSLLKAGTGTQTLSGNSTYTGTTTISQGTLAVDGSIATSAGVTVDTGATLQGHGYVSGVSGAGLVSPGNSAGILTASSIDPSLGTDFAFEFGQTGSPNYADAADSGNDVLRLTASTPILADMDGSNTVDIYLAVDELTWGATFLGGFYTDGAEDFLNSVEGAAFSYYVLGDGGGTHEFNGESYYALAESWPTWNFELATVADSAAFAGGTATGYVMQLTAVPEPGSLALLACSLLALLTLRRRRR